MVALQNQCFSPWGGGQTPAAVSNVFSSFPPAWLPPKIFFCPWERGKARFPLEFPPVFRVFAPPGDSRNPPKSIFYSLGGCKARFRLEFLSLFRVFGHPRDTQNQIFQMFKMTKIFFSVSIGFREIHHNDCDLTCPVQLQLCRTLASKQRVQYPITENAADDKNLSKIKFSVLNMPF